MLSNVGWELAFTLLDKLATDVMDNYTSAGN